MNLNSGKDKLDRFRLNFVMLVYAKRCKEKFTLLQVSEIKLFPCTKLKSKFSQNGSQQKHLTRNTSHYQTLHKSTKIKARLRNFTSGS